MVIPADEKPGLLFSRRWIRYGACLSFSFLFLALPSCSSFFRFRELLFSWAPTCIIGSLSPLFRSQSSSSSPKTKLFRTSLIFWSRKNIQPSWIILLMGGPLPLSEWRVWMAAVRKLPRLVRCCCSASGGFDGVRTSGVCCSSLTPKGAGWFRQLTRAERRGFLVGGLVVCGSGGLVEEARWHSWSSISLRSLIMAKMHCCWYWRAVGSELSLSIAVRMMGKVMLTVAGVKRLSAFLNGFVVILSACVVVASGCSRTVVPLPSGDDA